MAWLPIFFRREEGRPRLFFAAFFGPPPPPALVHAGRKTGRDQAQRYLQRRSVPLNRNWSSLVDRVEVDFALSAPGMRGAGGEGGGGGRRLPPTTRGGLGVLWSATTTLLWGGRCSAPSPPPPPCAKPPKPNKKWAQAEGRKDASGAGPKQRACAPLLLATSAGERGSAGVALVTCFLGRLCCSD